MSLHELGPYSCSRFSMSNYLKVNAKSLPTYLLVSLPRVLMFARAGSVICILILVLPTNNIFFSWLFYLQSFCNLDFFQARRLLAGQVELLRTESDGRWSKLKNWWGEVPWGAKTCRVVRFFIFGLLISGMLCRCLFLGYLFLVAYFWGAYFLGVYFCDNFF